MGLRCQQVLGGVGVAMAETGVEGDVRARVEDLTRRNGAMVAGRAPAMQELASRRCSRP